MNEYRTACTLSPLPFLIPTSLLFSLPLFVAASLCNLPHLFYTLSLILRLSYSDQMSNSCGAAARLINALEERREMEHNKQMSEGGRKRVRGKTGERRMKDC